MKCFSIFSGIGGFDLALRRAGHTIVGACEIDKHARTVYSRHFPGVPIHKDARSIKPDNLPDFDILVGGFPCQAFSIAGNRKGFEDTRGTLFFEIARIAQKKRPRYLLLENVKGLLSHDGGQTIRKIYQTLDELGYDTESRIINSKDFVPQNRERVFIVGHLRGERTRQVFPLGDCCQVNTNTLKESQGKTMIYLSQKNNNMRDRIQQRDITWTLTGNGTDFGIMEPEIKYHHQSESQYRRVYNIDGISPALDVGHAMQSPNIKQKRIRKLIPTECERLQGFPDGYTEGISDTQRYKCLGNAVTVPVVEYVLEKFTN